MGSTHHNPFLVRVYSSVWVQEIHHLRHMTILKPLDHRIAEQVWQEMSRQLPMKAGGKHQTISGISTVQFDIRHVGVLYKREFYRALTKGYLDPIFGCNLGEDQGTREHRVRLLGKRFWDFALCRGGFPGSNKKDGWIQMIDKSWRRPCDLLRHCLPGHSLNGQILKLGFHRACVHPTFQRIREEWVIAYGPACEEESSSDYDSSDDELLQDVFPKIVITKPVCRIDHVVKGLTQFKTEIKKQHKLHPGAVVHGPIVDGFKFWAKVRTSKPKRLDFFITPPNGGRLRSEAELRRHV